MIVPADQEGLTALLARGGFVAADEEATELLACADGDRERLGAMVQRRLTGEPLAWITGSVTFCGIEVHIDPGVYVPRCQTEQLAERAAQRLPEGGTAIDLCTGSGAIAKVLMTRRPTAQVLATDLDDRAITCARANGVQAHHGDLFAPLPEVLAGQTDVIVGVVPYVPTPELHLLQRDTFTFESTLAYEGGPDGAHILRRALTEATRFLKPKGTLLLELGGDQAELIRPDLEEQGYERITALRDEDGDVRGIEATAAAK